MCFHRYVKMWIVVNVFPPHVPCIKNDSQKMISKISGGGSPPCQSKFFLRIHEFFPKFPRVDHNYAKIGHKNSVSDKIRLKIFCALRARRKNDQNFAKICVPPLYGLSPPEIPPLSKLSPPGCPPPKGGDNFWSVPPLSPNPCGKPWTHWDWHTLSGY